MNTNIKVSTNLEVPITVIDKIEDLAVTERRIDLEDFVTAELRLAYNLGLNQGKIEALHAIREELDNGK